MSEAGFLSAIRDDPNDEATRLIYADYLDERDDPRGEFLRVESELLKPGLTYAEFDELRERAKLLRAILYPKHRKWLATVDAPDRYTVLLTNADCERLREFSEIGKPLRFVSFFRFGYFRPRPGNYVYAIRIHEKKLYLIGRMGVVGPTTREVYVREHPNAAALIPRHENDVLAGNNGTPIRPDTVVPHEMLQRFRSRAGEREYPLKHVKYGELTHPIGLTGVTRITKPTAQDFDFLLTGQVPQHLSI